MHNFTNDEINVLRDILTLPTTSFHEEHVQKYILDFVNKLELAYKTDKYGNILVHYKNGENEKPVVFTAHMDHPGFSIIERRSDNEYVAQFYGGTKKEFFPGARMLIYHDEQYIEAQAVSPLFNHREDLDSYDRNNPSESSKVEEKEGEDKREALDIPQFLIESRQEVRVDDMGFFDVPFFNIKGDLLYTKDADDVVNAGALLVLLNRVVKSKAEGEFYVLFTRAEETGFTGAMGAIESKILPEVCMPIVLETSAELEQAKIGQGFIIRVGDRFSVYNTLVDSWMHEIASEVDKKAKEEKKDFKFQRTLMDGGVCEASLFNVSGFDTGALAIALGNYHNLGKTHPAPEYISLFDLSCLVEFMQQVVVTPYSKKRAKYLQKRIEERFGKLKKYLEGNPYSEKHPEV